MPTTSSHSLPYPDSTDPADVPADIAALAEAVDGKLDAIAPGQITGPTSGQILIANSSGVVTGTSVTGDVTISNSGVTAIGAGAVGTTEIANSAVTTAKIDDAAVTAAKQPNGLYPPVGAILQYAASTAPTGWLICDGSEQPVDTYPALNTLLGTTYGSRTNGSGGSGTSHFRLPDLRGRVPVGRGNHATVNTLGLNDGTDLNNRRPAHSHTGTAASAGSHTHTNSVSTNGSHTHEIGIVLTGAGSGANSNYYRASWASGTSSAGVVSAGSHSHTVTIDSGGAHTHSVTVGSTGGTTDAPSFVVVNYIIRF